jgi:hypothetical protein
MSMCEDCKFAEVMIDGYVICKNNYECEDQEFD